jgi:hypothetical protein
VGLVAAAVAATAAHRRDEYLQAARIAVEPGRVRIDLDLTPGIAVAGPIIASIDRDGSGNIEAAEADAYAEAVRQALRLEIDGRPLRIELTARRFPELAAMRAGEAAIRLELASTLPPLAAGPHHLRFWNGHRPDVAVYLANALVPASDRVVIEGQRRDAVQRELIVDYVLRRADTTGAVALWLASLGAAILVLAALGWRRLASRRTVPVHPSSTGAPA